MLQPLITFIILLNLTYSTLFHLSQYICNDPILFLHHLIFPTDFIRYPLYAFLQLVPYCINFITQSSILPSSIFLLSRSLKVSLTSVFFSLLTSHFIAFFNFLTLCNLIFSLAITGL